MLPCLTQTDGMASELDRVSFDAFQYTARKNDRAAFDVGRRVDANRDWLVALLLERDHPTAVHVALANRLSKFS